MSLFAFDFQSSNGHPNGHVEIKDRASDIIASGGENISDVGIAL